MSSENHRFDPTISRRTLLRTAAGAGAGALVSRGLPAWAKPAVEAATHIRKPDSRPFPHLPAGHESMPEIKHVVMLMMENHSFDNLLGMVPYQVPGRQAVDGLTRKHGRFKNVNPRHRRHESVRRARRLSVPAVRPPRPELERQPPVLRRRPQRRLREGQRTDRDALLGPARPAVHLLAGQAFPDRAALLLLGAGADLSQPPVLLHRHGVRDHRHQRHTFSVPAKNGTIFDRLDAHHIDYRIYYQNVPSWLIVPGMLGPKSRRAAFQRTYSTFHADAAAGKLPAFTFIDPEYDTTSEENPQDIQVGERFVADVVRTLMRAPTWKHTALFINYDEHGGYYDHVAPPRAIKPDSTPPLLNPGDTPGAYDRYGFRVPMIVVSPWAKPNYVSNVVQDHTSITAFIERKWNLPAMTFRDANAQPMTDYFDFSKPAFLKPPALHNAPALAPGLAACHAQGLNPPLPPGVG